MVEATLPSSETATNTRHPSHIPGGYRRFPSAKQRDEYRRYDIDRQPHWAWSFAQYCLANHRRPSATYDGPWCVATLHMLRKRHLSGNEAQIQFGSRVRMTWQYIAMAHNIWRSSNITRWSIEARILGRQSDAEIAAAENLPEEVIAAYASLFFDVRDKLSAKAFINYNILELDRDFEGSDIGRIWGFFAFNSNAVVLQALIDDFKQTGIADYSHLTKEFHSDFPESCRNRWMYWSIQSRLWPQSRSASEARKLNQLALRLTRAVAERSKRNQEIIPVPDMKAQMPSTDAAIRAANDVA